MNVIATKNSLGTSVPNKKYVEQAYPRTTIELMNRKTNT